VHTKHTATFFSSQELVSGGTVAKLVHLVLHLTMSRIFLHSVVSTHSLHVTCKSNPAPGAQTSHFRRATRSIDPSLPPKIYNEVMTLIILHSNARVTTSKVVDYLLVFEVASSLVCELPAYSSLIVHAVMEAAGWLVAVLFWIYICSTSGTFNYSI